MISHTHRCIFVHIPRTGGTSIENVIWPDIEARTEADLWMGFVAPLRNRYQTGGLQHLLAWQIKTEVGERTFDAYFKFSIVRNPWDRAVSQYALMQRRADLRTYIGMKQNDSFKRYLGLIGRRGHVQWEPQARFLHDDNGVRLVDYVGRFEQIADAAVEIFRRCGIGAPTLPHHNQSERAPYQDYYDDEAVEMVAERYAEDIATFGYRFLL